MKNRSRPFECAIAGKTVRVTLRHGGGLQEPGSVYVRCDERDCQHVDLNRPPCPLRIDMFADGSDGRVAAHLAGHPGAHVCYACLTDALGITHEQVRRATWRLRRDVGVVIRPSRCSACRRRRVTIGLPGRLAPAAPARPLTAPAEPLLPGMAADLDRIPRVLQFIANGRGRAYCPSCLAFATDLPLADTRQALQTVDGAPEFERREGACSVCGRWQAVVALHPDAAPGEPRTVGGRGH